MNSLIAPSINLLILLTILIVKLREPLKEFVKERHRSLRDELEKTQTQLVNAQKKFQEYSSKLQAMDAEIEELSSQARKDAELTKIRVINEAQKVADTVVIDAKKSAESLFVDFKEQLRSELANQIISKAEALVRTRLTGDDRMKIVKDFSRQVGGVQ